MSENASKTALADFVLSDEADEELTELKNLMDTIASDFNSIGSKISTLQSGLRSLWETILDENTLDKFYQQV